MSRASWTYEIPPFGGGAVALEDYTVESAQGELVGKVLTVLRHEGAIFLVVERGTPPLTHDRRAVPWESLGEIDHSGLLVRLAVSASDVDEMLELDEAKAVEEGAAEASRVQELPPGLTRPSQPGSPGPVDRPSWLAALVFALCGAFAALVVVLLISGSDSRGSLALIALPIALFAAAGYFGYRFLFRRQAEPL